jgi:S1-C subfamily serine protease
MKFRLPHLGPVFWTVLLALLAVALLTTASPVGAAEDDTAAQTRALARASDSVVGIRTQAVEDARSNRTLGPQREGSGIVIGPDNLVVTIGYLVLEAEQVQIVTDDGRNVPARVLAYDVATGFALVQALAPLRIEPVPLGQPATLVDGEGLMVVSGGDHGRVGIAKLVSRRGFSGYWEYHIDGALFTQPPHGAHSGAGLFNARGELVGVGSLLVQDARGGEHGRTPGNMFVPVDLLAAALPELRQRGRTALSDRAWIGINCVEADGGIRVVRVNDDSPADVAGLKVGDRIVAIDGTDVAALEPLWKSLWSGGAPERTVTLTIVRDGERSTLPVHTVDRMKTLRRSQGI